MRPTNGGSIATRFAPWRSAITRRARHAFTAAALPLRSSSPTSSKAIAREAARNVGVPDEHLAGRCGGLQP